MGDLSQSIWWWKSTSHSLKQSCIISLSYNFSVYCRIFGMPSWFIYGPYIYVYVLTIWWKNSFIWGCGWSNVFKSSDKAILSWHVIHQHDNTVIVTITKTPFVTSFVCLEEKKRCNLFYLAHLQPPRNRPAKSYHTSSVTSHVRHRHQISKCRSISSCGYYAQQVPQLKYRASGH